MLNNLIRELTPPFLWRAAAVAKSKYRTQRLGYSHLRQLHVERNQHSAANEIELRDGLRLKIHPDSRVPFEHFCYRNPEMTNELDFFLEHAKGCRRLLDVGALHGIFALAFAMIDGNNRAVAVDASPIAFARLLYNTKKNALDDRVIPVELALSDGDGWLAMKYEWEHAVAGQALKGGADIEVQKTRGDALCSRLGFQPDVIKIDVEGHEIQVLRGLAKILGDCRPLVFLEVHPAAIDIEGNRVDEISELFQKLDYEIYQLPWNGKSKNHSDHRVLYRPRA